MPDAFTPARRDELRNEVRSSGFLQDNFLASDPDRPVFGVNLACAYPFPEPLAARYQVFASALQRVGSFVYVYPHWETHVTLATLLNFTQNRKPDACQTAYLATLKDQIVHFLQTEFEPRLATVTPFVLVTQPPVLSRRAVVLPFADPSGSVGQIRKHVTAAIKESIRMSEAVKKNGFNVPGIIHSTVARFTATPSDPSACLPVFDAAADTLPPTEIRVSKVLVTTETKPYMRGGEVIARFSLPGRCR